MKFSQMLMAVLTALGFVEKAKAETLTQQEWEAIEAEFQRQHGIGLATALSQALQSSQVEEEREKALAIINEAMPEASSEKEDEPQPSLVEAVRKMTELVNSQNATIAQLNEQLATLASAAKKDVPLETVQKPLSVHGPGTTEKHLFGIEHPVFAMDKRWNRIAQNVGYATLNAVDEEKDGSAFRAAVGDYGKTLAARYAFLKANKMLDPKKLAAGEFATNTTNLGNAGLGDQYVVIRQDALIAHVIKRQSVVGIFPLRSNIQDRELITNAFFSEVSQAWQPGRVFKGGMKLEPEMGYVDDSMAKIFFPQMKEIERLYIGYLNTDGSDPIKWSMIEWMLLRIYEQMISEQNHRQMMGIYVKPTNGTPGHYLNAGTGIVYSLIRYMNECKLMPLTHPAYDSYTDTTMLDAVKEFTKDFLEKLDVDQQASSYVIYLNDRHKPWWRECLRAKYKSDNDFSGTDGMMGRVPDTDIAIQWVPNMDNLKLMFIQQPGNLNLLENVPGEMFGAKMKDEMEAVFVWAVWKEGASASFVGAPFADFEALKANDFELQKIFMNLPSVTLEPGATVADARNGIIFMIGNNTGATALTDIKNARKGAAYILRCGEDTENATTVAKTGKFAGITKTFTPTKEGDYLMVVPNDAGDGFLELERCETGKRTINKKLQPNVPGGR